MQAIIDRAPRAAFGALGPLRELDLSNKRDQPLSVSAFERALPVEAEAAQQLTCKPESRRPP
jgi:hypothetical protein